MATLAELRQRLKDEVMGGDSRFVSDDWLNTLINQSIEYAWPDWYELGTASLNGASGVYTHSLDPAAKRVTRVFIKSGERLLPTGKWEMLGNVLMLDSDHAGQTLVYEYMAAPNTLSADLASTSVNGSYIIAHSAQPLLMALAQQETDPAIQAIYLAERSRQAQIEETARRRFRRRIPPYLARMR